MKKLYKQLLLVVVFVFGLTAGWQAQEHSAAREWNEALLYAIRNDFARPPVHARNLFHTAVAMYDAWAAYDDVAQPYLLGQTIDGFTSTFDGVPQPDDLEAARNMAVSFAAYRLLLYRFQYSPGALDSFEYFNQLMLSYGYDITDYSTDYSSGNPAALGNYIAEQVIAYGLQDGASEQSDYANQYYLPVNNALDMTQPGNSTMDDPNRWQPLELPLFIDQAGNPFTAAPPFQSPEWGNVIPFALDEDDLDVYFRDGHAWKVYLDPGPPPLIDTLGPRENDDFYRWGFRLVSIWQSHLDPADEDYWDISPGALGNNSDLPITFEEYQNFYNEFEGGDTGQGHPLNPATGEPYAPQIIKRADYARALAEFWADGPDSETPPGHWHTILNTVNDHPMFERKWMGQGEELPPLEWDVKAYFTLAGAMHDAAVAAWGVKGWFDYVRPVSAIRYMADRGQSTNPDLPSYHPAGIPLVDGYVELVGEGDPLAGETNEHVGKIKLYTWKGPDYIIDPLVDVAGVDWILAENWWPYQRPTFVTPPFAGYVSGHSTFSRAAAEVMTAITGSAYFPGGLGIFPIEANEFLVFEDGPSETFEMQWATYRDASDQCSLSRIWGGIHPPQDDIPGRLMGIQVAEKAVAKAITYFEDGLPVLTALSPSVITINNEMNGQTFTLTATFSQAMNTALSATVAFPNDDPTLNSLENMSQNWLSENTLEISWQITSSSDDLSVINVVLNGLTNTEGLALASNLSEEVFSVDMIAPELTMLTTGPQLINVITIGNTVHINLTFNEPMLLTSTPELVFEFPEIVDLLGPPVDEQWISGTLWRASYTVQELPVEIALFEIEASMARDRAGNLMVVNSLPAGCMIDTRRPLLLSLEPSTPTVIATETTTFSLTATFDEAMLNTQIDPNLFFTLGNNVFTPTDGFWSNTTSFTQNYTVAPAFEENGSVGVTLTNAFDIAVNSIIPLNLSDVFSLEGIVGITALNKHNESLVFPNPALREAPVFVQWSLPENGILTVYDAQGAKMHEEEVRNSSILALDFSKFAAGNYFIRLISENNSQVLKILLLDL
jgi:hypothetical protein